MPGLNRLAVISDVHGNRWALEAVLDDIDRTGITDVVNLGDTLYGPLDPVGTADILLARSFPTVCGNEDRIIVEEEGDESSSATLRWVREQLKSCYIEWLRGLQPTLILGGAFLCHGAPSSDIAYLLWEVGPSGARLRRSADVAGDLMAVESTVDLVLCGHDHVPRTMLLADGRTVVNPGSVGLPAYSDDHPHPHVMETGAPHARYAVVMQTERGWLVTDRSVPYDWQSAAESSLKNGRPDWARWLQTGQA
jgi:predicted phosphodiesterase